MDYNIDDFVVIRNNKHKYYCKANWQLYLLTNNDRTSKEGQCGTAVQNWSSDRKISAIAPVHREKSVDRRKDMSKITLKEVPYEIGDDTALNYCNVGADRNFEIVADNTYVIGHVYISEDAETSTGILCDTYVDWVEILTVFRNRHLLRPMLQAIYDMFGEFYFESAAESNIKFKHISECISYGISDITELEIFKYVGKEGDSRIKET